MTMKLHLHLSRFLLLAIFAIGLAAPAAHALQPDELLADPALEQRARQISSGLRCLVCQNQSIDDSDAPLARDLRVLVRERLEAGDSDAEVESFVVARYGDFVLLRPPVNAYTIILWTRRDLRDPPSAEGGADSAWPERTGARSSGADPGCGALSVRFCPTEARQARDDREPPFRPR
jgi:cytochrome c-type biogenesis protein CcmH